MIEKLNGNYNFDELLKEYIQKNRGFKMFTMIVFAFILLIFILLGSRRHKNCSYLENEAIKTRKRIEELEKERKVFEKEVKLAEEYQEKYKIDLKIILSIIENSVKLNRPVDILEQYINSIENMVDNAPKYTNINSMNVIDGISLLEGAQHLHEHMKKKAKRK